MSIHTEIPKVIQLRALQWQQKTPDPKKPVIVFLHGLGDGADTWRPVLDAWQGMDDMTAIAFDLPGHGGSDWLEPGQYNVPALAAAVTQALTERQIDRPIIVGHSLGARVALEIAADGWVAPQLTVLVDMNPEPNDGDPTDAQLAIADHIDTMITGANSLDELVRILKDRLPQSDVTALTEATRGQLGARPGRSVRRVAIPLDPEIKGLLKVVQKNGSWDLLCDAMSPIAILRGEFSGVLDRATATKMSKEVMRLAGEETIRGAGHAIALEQPKALAEAISRIVRKRIAHLS